MIDSHCHLDFEQFDPDRDQVLSRCKQIGIDKIIIPGTQVSRWQAQVDLCASVDSLFFALGIHPYFVDSANISDLTKLDEMLMLYKKQVVALGEIGLDFHLPEAGHQKQQDFFIAQLELADKYQIPVILHHRKSHNETLRLLKQKRFSQGGVVHAFSGSVQEAKAYIDMGFMLGVGGTITYSRAQKTRETFKQISLEVLVLETDAPDMPLNGRQGQRNSPEFLGEIAQQLAELKEIEIGEVIKQTRANSVQLFGLT